jgi:hypothetical protein
MRRYAKSAGIWCRCRVRWVRVLQQFRVRHKYCRRLRRKFQRNPLRDQLAVRSLHGRSDESRSAQTNRPIDSQQHRLHQKFRRSPHQLPSPQETNPTLGESAKQFARGFAHGVGEESLQIYNDTKQLPSQLAKTGREILEDIHANRRVRALAPLVAMEHAIRNASRKDVERIAHAVVDGAKEWLEKPAYEKGESLGRATTAIASEVAIDVLTEGIGSVATLRKVGKVAEAADHVRDAEKVVEKGGAWGVLRTSEGWRRF